MWLAHLLTVVRIPLAAVFWLVATRPLWALVVLAIAAATDVLDGRVARRARRLGATGTLAELGAWLDPLCDKVFAITVLLALGVRLHVPVIELLLIGAREAILVPLVIVYLATPLRRRFRYDFRSAPAGRYATIGQFLAVTAIVLDVSFAGIFVVLAAALGLYAAARYIERAAVLACWSILAFVHACDRLPSSSGSASQLSREPPTIECRIDDDCTLLPPAMTCCGECDPVPPFEAVPRTAVDALLLELETRCAEKPGPCQPPACESSPPGCEAYSTCVGGHCMVVQSGSCSGFLVVARARP